MDSETIKRRMPEENLITPYEERQVTRCAYELCMGAEAFITSTSDKKKVILDDSAPLVIPPGQFALLLTNEIVKVPLDSIAFISMRFGVKRKGLINVSGFHVDPGFEGRLKFSVYNAGCSPITISRGDRIFLIWYSYLDSPTQDGYGTARPDQNKITSNDQNLMHGEIASPGELKSQIDSLRHLDVHRKWILGVIAAAVVGILVRLIFMEHYATPSSSDIERLRQEIVTEMKQEFVSQKPQSDMQPKVDSDSTDSTKQE